MSSTMPNVPYTSPAPGRLRLCDLRPPKRPPSPPPRKMDEGKVLLSLDGGGIRGISQLEILHQMMHEISWTKMPPGETGPEEEAKPHEVFHLIGGSGTGGLIALMMHPLNLTVVEIKREYCSIMKAVFTDKLKEPRELVLQREAKRLVANYLGDENAMMKCKKSADCRVFVTASFRENIHLETPRLLRTYDSREMDAGDCHVWEAICATMACPPVLKPIKITPNGGIEISEELAGAFDCNPINQVYNESKQLWKRNGNPQEHATVLISIGSGVPAPLSLPREDLPVTSPEMFQSLLEISRDCISKDDDMVRSLQDHRFTLPERPPLQPPKKPQERRRVNLFALPQPEPPKPHADPKQFAFYYRFNVQQGLDRVAQYGAAESHLPNGGRHMHHEDQAHGIVASNSHNFLLGATSQMEMGGAVDGIITRRRVWDFSGSTI